MSRRGAQHEDGSPPRPRAARGPGLGLRQFLPFVMLLLVYLLDLRIPRGMGFGVVYTLVLLPSLWAGGGGRLLLLAALSTVASTVGFIQSPLGAVPQIAVTNRLVAIVAIWIIATVLELRQRSEQKLAASERALSTLLSNLPGMAYSARNEPGWPMLFVSDGALALTGYPAEAFVSGSQLYGEVICEQDRGRVWREVQEALEQGRQFDLLYRIIRPDGEVRTVAERGSGASVEQGQWLVEGFIQDVTERQRAQETEEFQSLLLKNVREAVIATDLAGSVTFWSHGAETLFGHSAAAAVGGRLANVLNPEQVDEGWDQQALQDGSLRGEVRHRRPDGEEVIADCVISAVRSSDGRALGLMRIYRDVTDRIRAEEELRLSRARLRAYIDASPAAIVGIDLEGRVELWNRAAERLFGWTAAEIVGQPYPLAAGDLQAQFRAHAAAVSQGQSIEQREVVRLRRDGTRIELELSVGPVLTAGDRVAGHVAVFLDIRERQRMERDRLRLITAIEQAAESVLVTDADGRIRYVNPAFERITGYRRDEVSGQHLRSFGGGGSRPELPAEIWRQLERGEVWRGQLESVRKDGAPYREETVISPIKGGDRIAGYVATTRDVTVEVELEEQLRQAQKMEAIGQLAGGVAHDFNNLLQVIRGHLAFAMEAGGSASPLSDDLDQADRAAERAAVLTRQLLAFSRRQVLSFQDLSLNALLDPFLKMLRRLLPADIGIVFEPVEPLPTVRIDAGQIEQVVLNLCLNARDAMPQGGRLTISTGSLHADDSFRADRPWAEPGVYCLLTVSDTGHGMTDEVRSRVFEPFFTTKDLGQGTGLGLAMAYGIVEQHNGRIEADSERGAGSTFRLYLPAVESVAGDLTAEWSEPIAGGSETILVAEDDSSILRLTVRTLERAGYRVFSATDGVEAWELFQRHRDEIELAVLDVVMPRLNGYLVWRRIQDSRPDLPVLFASGYQKEVLEGRFELEPGGHLLQKPYHLRDLLRWVRELLDRATEAADRPPR